jgi:L-alanine-DL-glutamate epimerase-like enolase superfamily enzyme
LPAYRLLGGKTRDRIRVYNTTTDYWAINGMQMGPDTREIVRFLLDRGITAMKIYPFRGDGEYIAAEEINRGVEWIREIKKASNDRMEICVDCWGRWDYVSAARVAEALEPFNILYLEDVMLPSSVDTYARLTQETSVPICMSETMATRYEYRELLEAGACDVVMFDCAWVGGPGEGKKVADMAGSYLLPVSPHTAGGPLLWLSSIHLCAAIPNFLIMESNYWKYAHQYPYFMANVPVPEGGSVAPPERPGLGAEIRPELFERGDAMVTTVAEA